MSRTLPTWIARWLGVDTAVGEGAAWSLEYRWPWPPWAMLLFAAFAVAVVVAIYLRESHRVSRLYRITLAAVRLLLVAIVLLMISGLALSLRRTGLPYLAVLLDDSLSMTESVDRYDEEVREELVKRIQEAPGLDESEVDPPKAGSSQILEPNRWNLAKTLLCERDAAMLAAMGEDYRLRFYYLTDLQPTRASDAAALAKEIGQHTPAGRSTRLGTGVQAVLDDLRGTPPAAIVLFTDGINTSGPPLAATVEVAKRKKVELLIVGLGSPDPAPDLQLSNLIVDPLAFVDDVVQFEFQLTAVGLDEPTVRVVLREEGSAAVLAQTEIQAGHDGVPQQVRLLYRPTQVGTFRYLVQLEPQPGEIDKGNNIGRATIEVRKEKIRVLLAQGVPSFEYRYLQRLLNNDDTIDLNWLLQDADAEYAQQNPAALRVFPVRREEVFSYDVIILGDVNPRLLSTTAMEHIVDFVDRPGKGGGLVLIAGANYMPAAFRDTPLQRLMPFDFSSLRYPDPSRAIVDGFILQPTELGLASPTMQLGDTPETTRDVWRGLPPLYWLLEIHDLKPGRVLAEHPSRLRHGGEPLPVISLHYVGAGKVLFHATDETHRWRHGVGDAFFARYWISTIRHLARSKIEGDRPVRLTTDRSEYEQGDPVRFCVRFAAERLAPADPDGVTVVIEHAGHRTRRMQLHRGSGGRGLFRGVLNRPAAGDYHAWIAVPALEESITNGPAPTVDFRVKPPQDELQYTQIDVPNMQRVAKLTGGKYYTFEQARRLLRDLPAGRQVPIESLPPKPLWNTWPVLLLFLMLLITEWMLRKRGGMV